MINGETHSVGTLYILYRDNSRFKIFFFISINVQIILGNFKQSQCYEQSYQNSIINKLIQLTGTASFGNGVGT